MRFLSDLVNCHVLSAGSLLQLLDNFVDAALEEGVPQVLQLGLVTFFLLLGFNRLVCLSIFIQKLARVGTLSRTLRWSTLRVYNSHR